MADGDRRAFLKAGALAGVLALAGCAGSGLRQPRGHVVVVGGGYGGATAAKYLRMWSARGVEVTLVERSPQLRLLPDVQSGHRRQPQHGRHHARL
jgi:sulfide dehydrogenase [flavocytochrome c] flavoprotein subunit